MAEAVLEACATGNLPLLRSMAEPDDIALADASPAQLASCSVQLPPAHRILEAAARGGQVQVLCYLRPLYLYRINRHIVMAAINTGSVETFAELALHDPTIITHMYGIFGNCLMSALRLPNPATFLAYLLEHGANPNNGLGTRSCPLSRVAGIGDVESVRLLLRHGAEIKDSGALWHAVYTGQRKIVEFLLDYGADINDYVSQDLEFSPAIHTVI
jgi:hypothetical protein